MVKPATRIPSSKARRLHTAARQEAAAQAALAEQAAAAAMAAEQAKKAEMAAKTALDDAKKRLDGSAQTNRNLLIAFYLLLGAGLMLCLRIGDEQLLLYETPVALPVLNLPVPIWAFASVVPLLLLVMHFDLLHNLNEHNHKLQVWLHAWNEVYCPPTQVARQLPVGVLSDQLYPFVFDFARLHGCRGGYNNINSKLLPGLCWALYCWAPFTVLMVYFIRFADLQNYWFTAWHGLLILLDAAWLYWYWPRFQKQPPAISHLPSWLGNRLTLPMFLMSISVLAGCWSLWLFIEIQYFLDFGGSPEQVNQIIKWEKDFHITLVPRITVVEFEPKLDKDHFGIAELLNPGKQKAEVWPETGHLINLQDRRLAFADLSSAVLPRALLDGAKLDQAILQNAKLPGATLKAAQLRGTNLTLAQLQGADLKAAQLQGANLLQTELQGANLTSAQLQTANLHDAKLAGADLSNALLHAATLTIAQLQASSLREAQLQGADLSGAIIEGSFITGAGLRGALLPDNAQLIVTSGSPDWKQPDIFKITANWAKVQTTDVALQKRLTKAIQRIKAAKPQSLPVQNRQEFTQVWLTIMCQRPEVAKSMLGEGYESRVPSAITDTDLNGVIAKKECQPYKALIEKAIKNRKIINE